MDEADLGKFLIDVYAARCKDVRTAVFKQDEAEHWRDLNLAKIQGDTLSLRGQLLGVRAAMVVSKVLRLRRHTKLDLYGNVFRDAGTASLCKYMQDHPGVTVLNLGCNDLSDKAARSICDLLGRESTLEELLLGREPTHYHDNKLTAESGLLLAQTLSENETRVRVLTLNGNMIGYGEQGDAAVERFAALLASADARSRLEKLHMADNGVSMMGGLYLCDALVNNRTLVDLDLHGNPLSARVGQQLGHVLSNNSSLKVLDLGGCQLGVSGVIAVAEAMTENRVVVRLNLANNECGTPAPGDGEEDRGDPAAAALAELVARNETLVVLNLARNGLRQLGAQMIAHALAQNTTLESLTMSKNEIGDPGAVEFAEAIASHPRLASLRLNSCKIADLGGRTLAAAVAHSVTLHTLAMNDNFFSEQCGQDMAQLLEQNTSLTQVSLVGNQISHNTVLVINRICTRNDQDQKSTRIRPLKNEVIRLLGQQERLWEAQKKLKMVQDQRSHLQSQIRTIEADMGSLQAEEQMAVAMIKDQIKDQDIIYKEVMVHLEEKNAELDSIGDEYAVKIEGAQKELQDTLDRKTAAQQHFDDVTQQLEDCKQTHEQRIADMKARIEAIRAEKAAIVQKTEETMQASEDFKAAQAAELEAEKARLAAEAEEKRTRKERKKQAKLEAKRRAREKKREAKRKKKELLEQKRREREARNKPREPVLTESEQLDRDVNQLFGVGQ